MELTKEQAHTIGNSLSAISLAVAIIGNNPTLDRQVMIIMQNNIDRAIDALKDAVGAPEVVR